MNSTNGPTVDGLGDDASAKSQAFTIEKLSEMCNKGRVSSKCPFTVGSGLNNRYYNDEIDQFVYVGNANAFDCLSSVSGSDYYASLAPCNTLSGGGGGIGTVFVRNISGGKATAGYVESKYWSNYNLSHYHEYDTPAWLCFVQGGGVGLDGPDLGYGTCQWNQQD